MTEGLARMDTAQRTRDGVVADFRELLRRFHGYQGEDEWVALTMNGALRFAREVALFGVRGDRLALLGQRGFPWSDGLTIDTVSAPALAAAIESKDVVFALFAPSEFGAALVPAETRKRSFAAPILNAGRVVALLFAIKDDETETDALELLAGIASLVLERQSNLAAAVQIAPAPAAVKTASKITPPAWDNLPPADQLTHARAQRFARVAVAELLLQSPDAARAGLEQSNVYLFLKKGIDAIRERYQKQFKESARTVDYLHLELVRTAAAGDECKLGEEYPGSMV